MKHNGISTSRISLLMISTCITAAQCSIFFLHDHIVLSQESKNENRFIKVGISRFYDSPVYLDMNSIKNIQGNRYIYTAIVDLSKKRGNEEDIEVDCDQPKLARIVRARYYKNGILYKTEDINHTQEEHFSSSNFIANKTVCSSINKKGS